MVANHQQKVDRVVSWLEALFPAGRAQAHEVGAGGPMLFRAEMARADSQPEFEITRRALEDLSADEIINALVEGDLPAWLRERPDMRLRLYSDGTIPKAERRPVECDGAIYHVVRDKNDNLRVVDSEGHLVPNFPRDQPVRYSGSIYEPDTDWAEIIMKKWL